MEAELELPGADGRSARAWTAWLGSVSLEGAAWTTLLATALLIRLLGLHYAPLEPDEARQALAAWEVTQGRPQTGHGSPLMLSLAGLAVFLWGPADAAVRLPSALLGLAAVAAARPWRPLLGGWGTLALAGLLAVGPASALAARHLGPAAPALLGALLLPPALGRRPALAAVGLSLLLLAGPAGWLTAGALAVGLVASGWRPSVGDLSLPWLAGALFLGSTAVLVNPLGLQGLADGLAGALASLAPGERLAAVGRGLSLLALYETLPLGLALAALAAGLWRWPTGRLVAAWAAAGLILAPPASTPIPPEVLPGQGGALDILPWAGRTYPLAPLAAPILVMAAWSLARLAAAWLASPLRRLAWLGAGLLLAGFSLHQLLRTVYFGDGPFLPLAAVGLGLLVLGSWALAARYGPGEGWLVLATALTALLATFYLGATSQLNYLGRANRLELIAPVTGHPQLPQALAGLAERQLRGQRLRREGPLPPELAWYLVRLPEPVGRTGEAEAVIGLDPAALPAEGYARREVAVEVVGSTEGWQWKDWLRWALYRRAPGEPEIRKASLWISLEP